MQLDPLPAGDQKSGDVHSHVTELGLVRSPRQRELVPQMLKHEGAVSCARRWVKVRQTIKSWDTRAQVVACAIRVDRTTPA